MYQSPRTRWQGQSVLPIYAMLFAMQCARSMYIVLVSWFALQITGEIASVGKVLICWQLLAFTLGPFIGPLIDRFQRRRLFAIGETIHGAGVGLLAFIAWVHSPEHTPITVLYVTACFVSVGSLLSYPSSQALIQQVGSGLLMRTVSFGILSSQVGNIVGAALGGICLTLSGVTGSLIVCAASSMVAAVLTSFLSREEHRTSRAPHMQDLVGGLLEIGGSPRLKVAGCSLLLAYASAHASNALLAGFARYDLKLSPNFYGWLAAMYSGGGLVGSVIFAGLSGVARERALIGVGTVLLAVATAAFSTSQTMAQAVLWQGLVGLSFMMVRAASDVTILKTVSNQMVGRVRSNIDAGIGLVAVVIYLLPTLARDVPARHIFLGLAGLFACGSCAILWLQRRGAKAEGRPVSR
ncbi:MFS transporter [Mesorhizobium sp. INR15]|uniref:MFS transporter n=1 Tax=Mesorhizobium sp. INR15 TaxID=2654248 RepID=UPI001896A14A|nr:MFS transporter [Mesorhizobium sp. INR15]QPC95768.1 MFS transporter [Mesorhizobium sp. INR15]